MTKNEETILDNLVKTLQDFENECFRKIAYMNEHKFEIEREAIRYKQQAFNRSWLEVANAIDEIKELKKIEQKHTWSEEDEKNLQGIIDEITANKNQAPDYDHATYDRFLSWLKSLELKESENERIKIEQKPAWSEEDERIRQCLIRDQEKALDDVRNDKYGHSEIISDLKEMYRERINWLESLKERLKG